MVYLGLSPVQIVNLGSIYYNKSSFLPSSEKATFHNESLRKLIKRVGTGMDIERARLFEEYCHVFSSVS